MKCTIRGSITPSYAFTRPMFLLNRPQKLKAVSLTEKIGKQIGSLINK